MGVLQLLEEVTPELSFSGQVGTSQADQRGGKGIKIEEERD